MNYREAREEDADTLVEMANEELMQQDLSEATMRDMVQDRSITVAEEDEEVVGYVSYRVMEGAVVVQHVCVQDKFRDSEVPTHLIQRPVEFAESEGLKTRLAVERDSWIDGSNCLEGFEHVADASFGEDDLLIYEL